MRIRKILGKLKKRQEPEIKKNISEEHSWQQGLSTITRGRFTYTGDVNILQWGEGANLSFGQFCSIAQGLTVLLGGNHRTDWSTTFPFGHIFSEQLGGTSIQGHPATRGDVRIGNDVWLGLDVTILSGVQIGDGAVVAAKSVVTKSIAPFEIWGGNPATKIKSRFPADIVGALLELAWWDMPIETVRVLAPLLSQPPSIELITHARHLASLHR